MGVIPEHAHTPTSKDFARNVGERCYARHADHNAGDWTRRVTLPSSEIACTQGEVAVAFSATAVACGLGTVRQIAKEGGMGRSPGHFSK